MIPLTVESPEAPAEFLTAIQKKAEWIGQGFQAGRAAADGPLSPEGLLFAGMGGSGITANLVKDACTRVLDLPFTIVKHYQFPNHVKPDWHCMALSYSGETEETLAVAREAKARGVPITAFTTGGTLAGLADHTVDQPPGYYPRVAMTHAWFSMLGYLEGTGLLNEPVPVEEAAAAVQEVDKACGPDVPEDRNEARQLARILADKIPQIYATPAFYGSGLFFRAMLNENAKKIAHVELVPEANHNDFTGWGGDPNRQHFTVLALSHGSQNPDIQKRLAYMKGRYEDWGLPWHHHEFNGVETFRDHVIEQARAVQLLDYASCYVAELRGVDPSEIKEILALKEYLRRA